MKTVFDSETREVLIKRIQSLNESSQPFWGKMNAYQMVKHCVIWNQWVLGVNNKIPYKQIFIGKLFGKMVLKNNTKDDRPMGKNAPAGSDFLTKEKSGDLLNQIETWTILMEHYAHYDNPDFIHDFFGRMTKEQIGIFTFKHMDHHLRQFGV